MIELSNISLNIVSNVLKFLAEMQSHQQSRNSGVGLYTYDSYLHEDLWDKWVGNFQSRGRLQSAIGMCILNGACHLQVEEFIDLDEQFCYVTAHLHLLATKYEERQFKPFETRIPVDEYAPRFQQLQARITDIVGAYINARVALMNGKVPERPSTPWVDKAKHWAKRRAANEGPTVDQQALVDYLIECGGTSNPDDINMAMGKKWRDPRRSCRQLVDAINSKLTNCLELWRIAPEDRGEVVIIPYKSDAFGDGVADSD